MLQFKVPVAITTLSKEELLPEGAILTDQVVADIAALGRLRPRDEIKLLEFGTIRDDLLRLLTIPPYDDVFCVQESVEDIFGKLQGVKVPLPILQTLDYFRLNDFHTYRHILIVFSLSLILIDNLYKDKSKRAVECLAGPSHDIGKISVPLEILKKPGPLSEREKEIFKFHPLAGYVLLSYYLGDHLHPAVLVARDHHERLDGSGYPQGLAEQVSEVRVVATCDVYDALLSPRPYRPLSYDNRTALEELTRMAQKGALGWPCVEGLIACSRHGYPDIERVIVSKDVRGTPPIGECCGVSLEDK